MFLQCYQAGSVSGGSTDLNINVDGCHRNGRLASNETYRTNMDQHKSKLINDNEPLHPHDENPPEYSRIRTVERQPTDTVWPPSDMDQRLSSYNQDQPTNDAVQCSQGKDDPMNNEYQQLDNFTNSQSMSSESDPGQSIYVLWRSSLVDFIN